MNYSRITGKLRAPPNYGGYPSNYGQITVTLPKGDIPPLGVGTLKGSTPQEWEKSPKMTKNESPQNGILYSGHS